MIAGLPLYTLRAIALLLGLLLSVAQVVSALNNDLVGAATFDAMLGVGVPISPLVHSQKNKTRQE
jgi:ABC-type Mn2+/Zn2+ transport system permease subunit